MALTATLYKAGLAIADIDRHYYADHTLTLARHPSETEERLMVRLFAFACHASDSLHFSRGLSSEDEPALWAHRLNGEIDLWLEVGQPDERRLRRACHRAAQVVVYSYGSRAADLWWQRSASDLAGLGNLAIWQLETSQSQALAALAARSMQLQFTRQEGECVITNGQQSLTIAPHCRQLARQ
jgi:uncharacterized protein YaeQ